MLNRNTLGPITVCRDVVSAVVHVHPVPLYLVSKQTWILNRRPLWLKCLRSDDMTLSQPSAVHRPWLTKCHLCFVCGAGSLAGSTTDALRSESSTGSSQLSPIPSPGMCCREVRPFMSRHTHTQAHTHIHTRRRDDTSRMVFFDTEHLRQQFKFEISTNFNSLEMIGKHLGAKAAKESCTLKCRGV